MSINFQSETDLRPRIMNIDQKNPKQTEQFVQEQFEN